MINLSIKVHTDWPEHTLIVPKRKIRGLVYCFNESKTLEQPYEQSRRMEKITGSISLKIN